MGLDQTTENTGRWTPGAIAIFENGITKYTDYFISGLGGEYETGVAREVQGEWSFTVFSGGRIIVNNRTQRSRTIGRGI